jgi:hypothetical protein
MFLKIDSLGGTDSAVEFAEWFSGILPLFLHLLIFCNIHLYIHPSQFSETGLVSSSILLSKRNPNLHEMQGRAARPRIKLGPA